MNERYYSELDKIVLRSRRRKQAQRIKEVATSVAKFLGCAALFYGTIFFTWCAICAIFPTWP